MPRLLPSRILLAVLLTLSLLTGCRSPQATAADISVSIRADGETSGVTLPAGSTVSQALQNAGISAGNLDKVEPPLYTVLSNGDTVTIVRVE